MPEFARRAVYTACLLVLLAGCRTAVPVARPPGDTLGETRGDAAGFEDYYQSVREGAAGPGLIRGSGGCGCN